MITLDKFHEQDDVAVDSAPVFEMNVPAGEQWAIYSFGGSTYGSNCEVHLEETHDNGTTWSRVRVLHFSVTNIAETFFTIPLVVDGSTNTKLRFVYKNYGTGTPEISGWINGSCRPI